MVGMEKPYEPSPVDFRRNLCAHALRGAWGFGLVGMVVYATVAFGERALYRSLSVGGAYALWTVIFLVGAPAMLGQLMVEREGRVRFARAFVFAFLAYAGVWMLIYLGLKSRTAEVAASILAPAAMAAVYAHLISPNHEATPLAAMALLVSHTAGYFLGAVLYRWVGGSPGMLFWGAAHCVLFGAGIGWMIGLVPRKGRTVFVPGPP